MPPIQRLRFEQIPIALLVMQSEMCGAEQFSRRAGILLRHLDAADRPRVTFGSSRISALLNFQQGDCGTVKVFGDGAPDLVAPPSGFGGERYNFICASRLVAVQRSGGAR